MTHIKSEELYLPWTDATDVETPDTDQLALFADSGGTLIQMDESRVLTTLSNAGFYPLGSEELGVASSYIQVDLTTNNYAFDAIGMMTLLKTDEVDWEDELIISFNREWESTLTSHTGRHIATRWRYAETDSWVQSTTATTKGFDPSSGGLQIAAASDTWVLSPAVWTFFNLQGSDYTPSFIFERSYCRTGSATLRGFGGGGGIWGWNDPVETIEFYSKTGNNIEAGSKLYYWGIR